VHIYVGDHHHFLQQFPVIGRTVQIILGHIQVYHRFQGLADGRVPNELLFINPYSGSADRGNHYQAQSERV
jgi:hypothetical protein